MKVRFCKIINIEINILILDEFINYLDVDVKDELKRVLKEYKGIILLVFYEFEFYRDVIIEIWNCEDWIIKII